MLGQASVHAWVQGASWQELELLLSCTGTLLLAGTLTLVGAVMTAFGGRNPDSVGVMTMNANDESETPKASVTISVVLPAGAGVRDCCRCRLRGLLLHAMLRCMQAGW